MSRSAPRSSRWPSDARHASGPSTPRRGCARYNWRMPHATAEANARYMQGYGRVLRAKRKSEGLCGRCGKQPSRDGFTSCEPCAEYARLHNRIDRSRHQDRQRNDRDARVAQGLCSRCGKNPLTTKRFCRPCVEKSSSQTAALRRAEPERVRTQYRASRERLRHQILERYGRACVCCGEQTPVFLTVDHINGGGNQHLREIGRRNLWGWLRARGFPYGFQTLCWNCNAAKGILGACPHARNP